MKIMHTTHGPVGDSAGACQPGTVQVVRYGDGTDGVRALGRVWTPAEADQIARLLAGAAGIAAAHNAGTII